MKRVIEPLISEIRRKALISAIIAISIFLVTASVMRRSGSCLKTEAAPRAIISFELAFTNANASKIKNEWDYMSCVNGKTATTMAIKNTQQDFFFIIGYTSLIIVFAVLFPRKQDLTHDVLLVQLALGAAACDVIENLFMLIYLKGTAIPPFFFGFFASVKFFLLVFVVMNIFTGIFRKVMNRPIIK